MTRPARCCRGAIAQTRDRLCTVGRTLQLGAPSRTARPEAHVVHVGQPVVTFVIVTFSSGCPSPGLKALSEPLAATFRMTSRPLGEEVPEHRVGPGGASGLVDEEELRTAGVRLVVLAMARVPAL